MPKTPRQLPLISKDVTTIFRLHYVKGHGHKARRALAKLLNVPFQTHGDQMRQKIAALRESGLTYKQIAKVVGLTKWMIWSHLSILKKQRPAESPQSDPVPSSFGRG